MAALPQQATTPLLFCAKPTITVPSLSTYTSQEEKESKRCCFDGCKKKLSLTDFACKCGKKHCAAHRPAEVHKCSFDYKALNTNNLLKTMSSSVVAAKIDKI